MTELAGKRILLTGGAGFLGRRVRMQLETKVAPKRESELTPQQRLIGGIYGEEADAARSPGEIVVPRSAEYDLTEQDAVRTLVASARPDLIIHLAAEVGGIGANRANPGRYFYANMAMGLHLVEEARKAGVEKFVQVGTVCAYPKDAEIPFREETLWEGYPEETNAPYGIAKKSLLVMLQGYRHQYGLNGIYLLPVNLYGPEDNFDLETSHVIPALIRKFIDARRSGSKEVEVWGTGSAGREFLYVDDAARAIVLATERYDGQEPVNLGTGREIKIKDLVELIAKLTGFNGEVRWDTSKPDGQPRRMLETSKAAALFGFKAEMELEEGLKRTVDWWEQSSG